MFQLDVARDAFDQKFRDVGGQFYFTLKGADWMIPVTEDEYYKARDLSALIAKMAFALTWAVNLGGTGYAAYLVLFQDRPLLEAFLIWLAIFAACFIINLYPQTIPTMGMWHRLRAAQQLDEATKSKLLVRRTELI